MIAWLMRHPFLSGLFVGLLLSIYPVGRSVIQARIMQKQVAASTAKIESLNKRVGSAERQSTDLYDSYGTCLAALRLAEDRQKIFEQQMSSLKVKAQALRLRINRAKKAATALTAPTTCTTTTGMAIDAGQAIKSYWEGP